MGIWKNIGKIVILVFQIVHEQVKWYIVSWKRDTTKKSNIPISKVNNIQHSTSEILNEEQESRERSKLMVELCEQPYYTTTNTKHKPE